MVGNSNGMNGSISRIVFKFYLKFGSIVVCNVCFIFVVLNNGVEYFVNGKFEIKNWFYNGGFFENNGFLWSD